MPQQPPKPVADQLDLSSIADQLDLSGLEISSRPDTDAMSDLERAALGLPPKDKRSTLAKMYDTVFSPIPAVQKRVVQAANALSFPEAGDDERYLPGPLGIPIRRDYAKGAAAGMLEGLGALLTPGDIALTAATPLRALKAAPQIARLARGIEVAGMAGMTARGVERATDAEGAGDVGAGGAQVALGLLGMKAPTRIVGVKRPSRIVGALPSAPIAVTPDGAAVLPGGSAPAVARVVGPTPHRTPPQRSARPAVVIGRSTTGHRVYSSDPNAPAAALDPAGVLADRAESLDEIVALPDGTVARRRDLLGAQAAPHTPHLDAPVYTPQRDRAPVARPAAVIDRSTVTGERVYSSDPTATPATVSAAALPERAQSLDEFMAVPGGAGVVRRRDAIDVDALVDSLDVSMIPDAPPAPAKKGRGKQKSSEPPSIIPAAVADRVYTDGYETNRIFSSDPSAVDVPPVNLTPRERVELQRMASEIDSIEFTPRTRVDIEGAERGKDEIWLPGGAGSPITSGIAQGRKITHAQAYEAIQNMLKGKSSVLGQLALQDARNSIAGKGGARRLLPDDAGVRNQWLKGTMDDEDFQGFSDSVDDMAALEGPRVGREPGEEGRLSAELLNVLGGAAAGGTIGAASGEDTQQQITRGLLGAATGAVGVHMLQGGGGPRPQRIVGIAQSPLSPGAGDTRFATTGRPAPRPHTPHADPMQGTEVFLGKFAPEIREGVKAVLERNGGFDAQRRGVVNQADVDRLAQGIAVDLQRVLKPGTALNAEAISAHVNSLATAQSKVNELAAKVARGQNTDADLLALESARAEVNTIAASVMGARSEAGRSLAQWRILARVLESGNPQLMAEAAAGLRGNAAQFAATYSQLPQDPLERFRWLQQQERPSLMERTRQYYLANILSGVKTHERNAIGNAANALSNLATHPAAAGVDAVRSTLTGAPRTAFLSEIPSQTWGMFAGVEKGFHEALFSIRHGVNRSALTQSLSAAEAGKLDVPRIEFGGGGANPLNWPGRALDGADQFFRAIARNMELQGLAHAQAKREGLTGNALADRMAELTSGAGEAGAAIAEKADAFARRAVFQEKAGPLVAHLQVLAQKYPPLSFVIPFIRTPANILRQGAEFSPAGFAMPPARAGGREGAQAVARASLGTIGAAGLAWLASTGRLTGNGPSDPIERAQLLESGWRPNSVRIGDQWVEVALFQPVSVPAMAIANAFESWRSRGMREADVPTKALEAVRGFGRSVLDLSFMDGIAELFGAFSKQGGAGQKFAEYLGRTASGFVPFAGAQRTAVQGMDATVRDPEGFSERIMSGIPGLSDNLPARMDRFGRDVKRPGGPVRRMADPFSVSPVNLDPVVQEVGRVRMGHPTGHIAGLDLTREQERKLKELKGTAAYEIVQRALASPGYTQLSDGDKAAALDRLIDSARRQTQQQFNDALLRQLGGR